MPTATGADSLLGFVIDGPSDRYSAGHAGLFIDEVATPDAPTSVLGPAGLITGTVAYKVAHRRNDGSLTAASPASVDLVTTLDKAEVTWLASASAACDAVFIYRSENGGAFGLIHQIWDNTTLTWTDNTPIGSDLVDYDQAPITVNQTSGNWGFGFVDADSFDLAPDFTSIPSTGLSGKAGKTRGAPGPINIDGSTKIAMRAGLELPFLTAAIGKPVIAPVSGEPVTIATWNASVARRSPRTLTALSYKGSEDIPPSLLYQLAVTETDFAFDDGKMVSQSVKVVGANFGLSGPATKVSGSGTYAGTFVAMGRRFDALAATDDVYIKITQALSGGTFAFKAKVGAGSTYSGAAITGYANAVSSRMTKGGALFYDAIELVDENGNRLGADSGSNRLPFLLLATHPLTGIAVDDIYVIPRTCPIPGAGSSPFTGVPARFIVTPRFTDAHVTITKGGTVVDAMTGSLKLSTPKKKISGLGAMARMTKDIVNDGVFGVQVSIKRNYDSTEYEDVLATDDRASVVVTIEGERIPITPATLSTHREGLSWTMPQMMVKSVKSPVSGDKMIEETIELEAEQPDNPESELFTTVLKTRVPWRVPA